MVGVSGGSHGGGFAGLWGTSPKAQKYAPSCLLRGFQLSCGYLGAILELFCLGQLLGWSWGVSGTCRAF